MKRVAILICHHHSSFLQLKLHGEVDETLKPNEKYLQIIICFPQLGTID